MSEVLSQSEIDALLSAISSGEINASEIRDTEKSVRVRSYDFRRAMRFSKDHLRVLKRMHEHFSRLLTTHLSGQLRTVIQIQVESVDQVPYEEFIRSIPMLTILNLMEMAPLEGRVVLEINPQIVFAMLDRLMGGDSGTAHYRDRELTDIEMTLMRRLLGRSTDLLAEAWSGVAHLEPEFVSVESNPQFVQLTTPNETVLVVAMSVKVGETTGLINLCIPHTTIEPLLPMLNNHYMMGEGRSKRGDTKEMSNVEAHMMKIAVDLGVQLGHAQLSVDDVLGLDVGDTILLDTKIQDPVLVSVSGTPAYFGSVGKHNQMYAVKILREWEED